jgi:hypothetical protein
MDKTIINKKGLGFYTISLLILLLAALPVSANQDLAKAAQNPIADMISLPLQNNTGFNYGPQQKAQNILNIQPVWPFSLSADWNVITRTVIPIVSQPPLGPNQDRTNGIGNTTISAYFSPKNTREVTWGVGPVLMLPAGKEALGTKDWGGGISFVVLTMPGHWVVGSLFSQVWSFGSEQITPESPVFEGESFDKKVNLFTWQYFINYNLSDGWYLTSSPIITANWEASSGNRWTVPLGGGVGKIFKIGKQPMNTNMQLFYNAERPDFGADWTLRFQLTFLFPK